MQGTATHAALGWIVAALAVAALAAQRDDPTSQDPPAPVVRHPAPAPELRALRDGQRLDLNHASIDELTLIPGIGPKLAGRIVTERAARGGYARLEDVRDVRGVGPKTWERMRPFVELRREPQKRSITYDADAPALK